MILIYFIVIIAFIYINYYKSKRSLHMLQSNLYNENNRYLKWVIKNKKELLTLEFVNIGF